jgi:4-hydroxybenzoate polyprenyltransferase
VSLRPYLELLRPANVVTALADVLAGYGVAGLQNRAALPWLLGSTACLYAGGVVLNDVFDRELDRRERPERPIPSGRVAPATAAALGAGLLAAGTLLAFRATPTAGVVAGVIALLVVAYDGWGKRHAIGPVNMGLCRALNLLLGVAAVPAALTSSWPLALIPLLYICAVTTLSRGEVHGGRSGAGTVALVFLTIAWLGLAWVAVRSAGHAGPALLLVAALAWRVAPPFWRARQTPAPAFVRIAVQRGVLSLVLVDATIGAAYAGPLYAAIILLTGLVAGWLARVFAVT